MFIWRDAENSEKESHSALLILASLDSKLRFKVILRVSALYLSTMYALICEKIIDLCSDSDRL